MTTKSGKKEIQNKVTGNTYGDKTERDETFADVYVSDGPDQTITYRSALAVYEDSLVKGQFVGRGWNGAGFINFFGGRVDTSKHPTPQSFWLEMDGQLLASDWEWVGLEKKPSHQPIPAMPRPFALHTIITLRHRVRPVTVKVHMGLDGTPVMTRWLEITNNGSQPAALTAACPWSGVLNKTLRWRDHLPAGGTLYSLGYFDNAHWGNEGDFQWHDLPNAEYCVDGRYRQDRHRHPFFVLRNNATGEHFIGQLAWSGGYRFEFDAFDSRDTHDSMMFFRVGPDAPPPQRIVAPGETVFTPEMHLGLVFGGLDESIQAMHDHLRTSVLMVQPRGKGGWIESAIGPEIEITEEQVFHAIDAAADLGAEIFFIDAGWYAPPGGSWHRTVGDWNVDLKRFPHGLTPFRDRVHQKGMLWGLWMDAERLGRESETVKRHPDWLAVTYDGNQRLGDMIDLANPEVAAWMEAQICRVIEENGLEFFRLDYNTGAPGAGPRTYRDGYVENGLWRYYEALYAIYDRLRARFPDVVFENCAGGGGRTDIGHVRRFSHTWVTDWQNAPRSFAITNGMTMALPPEFIDRLIGGQGGHTTAELDFQWRLLLFARPTVAFPHPLGSEWNPVMLERMRHWLELYKNFVRPMMSTGRIYHHTPVVNNPEPQGWGVLELASRDRARAICGLFQLAAPGTSEYLLRLRGIDAGRRYRVTFDNRGQTCLIDGWVLMNQGITVRLEGALTSELLIIDALQ